MQPLKSREKATSPIEAAAIALLRSTERYQPPPGLKQRVRMRLLEAPSRRLRYLRTLRPVLIASSILIAAGASAALGRNWLLSSRSIETSRASDSLRSASTSQTGARHAVPDNPPALHETPTPPASVSDPTRSLPLEPLAPIENAAPRAGDSALRGDAPPRADAPGHPTAVTEKGLVFDAMRALRREGQPDRAARLLDEYLRRYPRGSLCEEALALAIEANSALGDPKAKSLADRYLTSYPEGRFRPAALRARARFAQ